MRDRDVEKCVILWGEMGKSIDIEADFVGGIRFRSRHGVGYSGR